MHEQTMARDAADFPADRLSIFAYVITALGLAGIVAAIILLTIGRGSTAYGIALACWGVGVLSPYFAQLGEQPNAFSDGKSPASDRANALGFASASFFLMICYFVRTWPLDHDAPVVFSQSELSAAFWISLSMVDTVPRAYRLWRKVPSVTKE